MIYPDWPAPSSVKAICSTREGGVSQAPYHSLNLGAHVGDNLEHVEENRQHVFQDLNLPNQPCWLNQTHSTTVAHIDAAPSYVIDADASFTTKTNYVCVVMTADCLPVLLCNKQGTQVAAVHAGWRGLCDGIIEKTIATFSKPRDVMAYLGPAIGYEAFVVGTEVRQAFINKDEEANQAFKAISNNKYKANLYQLASQRCQNAGVNQIYGGTYCTYHQENTFFSYRRDGVTGRQAGFIWIAPS